MRIKIPVILLTIILVKTACLNLKLSLLGGERWKVVGFFHICHGNENRTLFNKKASVYNETAEYVFGESHDRNMVWNKMFNGAWIKHDLNYRFDYISIDVCDVDTLVEKLSGVFLDQQYFLSNLTEDPPLFNNKPIPNWRQQSNVLLILAYLPEHFMKIYTDITIISSIPMVMLNGINATFLNYAKLSRFKIHNGEYAYTSYKFLSQSLKTDTINLILFREETETFDEIIFFAFIRGLRRKKICVDFIIVSAGNMTDYKKALNLLKKDQNNKTIILYGNEREQVQLLQMAMNEGLDGRTWLLHNVLIYSLSIAMQPSTTVYSLWTLNLWFCSYVGSNRNLFPYVYNSSSTHGKYHAELEAGYIDALCELETIFDVYINTEILLKFPNHTFFTLMFSNLLRRRMILFKYVQHNKRAILTKFSPHSVRPVGRKCHKFICRAGWERTYGQLLPQHTHWNNSYGWTCSKCPLGYFKDNSKNESCKRCLGYNISNNERTLCIDPFVKITLSASRTSVRLALALSALNIVLSISTLILFFKHRSTPVVKAADLKFSTFHLTISCIIGISLPLLYIGIPSDKICLWRYISVTISFSASLAIIALKSYKIIKVFEANVVFNKNEVLMTPLVQIGYIVMLILIGLLILCASILNSLPRVQETWRMELWQIDIYCKNELHIEFQIAYYFMMLLLCVSQAYRGRRLPTIFNEVTPIIYCSFTLCIIFLIHFSIFFFQKDELSKCMVQWMVLSTSNLVLVVLTYTHRVYTILFQPNRNTISHVRKKLQEHTKSFALKKVPGSSNNGYS